MMQALFLSLTVKLFCVMGFFGTPALCISKPDIHYSDVHTAILQNSMKVLFGADEGRLPRDKNKRLLPDPDEPARPPRYMMELYERYRDGLLQKENFGNTVRSIHASVGEINGNAMFFFNLSAVKSSEKVLRAEVHLYKRKQQPWIQTGSRLEILLHEIGPNYISETGRVTLHRASRGWQWRDVTEAVLSCLATSRKPPHLFAINFKTQKSKNGKIRPVPLKKFSTHHSRPFLIIYSNETETVKLDQLDKLAERLKLFLPGHQSEQSHIDQLGKNITAMPASGSETGFGKTRLWPQVETISEAKNGSKKENNRKNRVSHSMTDVTDRQHLKINIKKAISIEEEERKSAEKESVTLMTVNENTRKDQKLGHVISESSVTSSSIDSNSGSNSKSSFNKSHFISKAHSRHATGKHHHFAPKIRKTEAKVILVGTSSSLSDDPHAGSTNSTSFKRLKRSILTNEIPQDPVETKTVTKYNVLHTNPGVLQTRQQRAKNKKDSRLIPYPKESQNKKNRRKRKRPRRKNTRRRRLRFPKDWKSESDILSNQNAENEDHLCKRRKLHVNFDDIGWGEWIISPRWFNAHYCSGSCPFPLTKNLHPSNHATIQSIVHAIGIYPGVPAPSCVPDSVSSITLLYFDEDRNVVLKNYPGMTVLTCACR